MTSEPEIRALVSLLGDEDVRITSLVWEQLGRLGPACAPALREASEASDPRLRLRARKALLQLTLDEVEADLRDLTAMGEDLFDLEAAFTILARISYPELRHEEVKWALDDVAVRIRSRLAGLPVPVQIRVLNQVLHGEMGFSGVLPDWRDLDPACINRVLELRRGVPITLGVVYLLIAKRLHIPFVGVHLPHHFLVKYAGGAPEIFVDPFAAGKVLTRRECVAGYLRDYYPKEDYIQEASPRDITVRAIRGLLLVFAKRQDRMMVRRLGKFLEILQVREKAR